MSTITLIQIWERLIQPDGPNLAPEVARQFLRIRFPQSDIHRMNELAAKARQAALPPDEKSELDEYLLAGGALELLHAKARLVMAQGAEELADDFMAEGGRQPPLEKRNWMA